MSNILRAHLALIAANLIYGVNYGIAKQVMPDYLSPFALVFARISGACILFWALSLFLPGEKIERKDILRLFIATVFGVAVNQSLFLNGLNITTPIDAAIIMTATPILVLIVARLLIREPITLFKVIGIVAGGTGAVLLILYRENIGFSGSHVVGNSIILANATSYALYLVIVKPLMDKYQTVTLMKWIFLFGLLLVSGPGIPAFMRVNWDSMPGDIILSVFFVVVGTTFMAYLLNMYSLKYVKPITVSIYIYSQPVIASIVALILRQDVIAPVKIVAALLVFTGVYFVSFSSSKSQATN
jgi:drug/metabolite transporter (DMT)-like permease